MIKKPYLTKRQMEILTLLDDGLTLREIARKLWLEDKTIRTHARLLRRALKAKTNAQAVGIGHSLGILPVVSS